MLEELKIVPYLYKIYNCSTSKLIFTQEIFCTYIKEERDQKVIFIHATRKYF